MTQYVVVADVLSEAEVAQALGLGWDLIEAAEPGAVSRSDPRTWSSATWPSLEWLAANSRHSAAMWFVRGAEGVRRAWAALVGTEDLIVSFDQLGMYPLGGRGLAGESGAWYHTDQSPRARPWATQGSHGLHRDYAQGFVSLQRTAAELDGNVRMRSSSLATFRKSERREGHLQVVIPGSHRQFEQWAPDYFDLTPGMVRGIRYDLLTPEALPNGCQGITTHLEPGDAFVWDSRTLRECSSGLPRPSRCGRLTQTVASARRCMQGCRRRWL